MKKMMLAVAIGAAMAGGCARLSPTFDTEFQERANTVPAVKLSQESDRRNPFDVSAILTRPASGGGSVFNSDAMMNLETSPWDVAGDAAIKIVSNHAYADIKAAMGMVSVAQAIGRGMGNIAVADYVRRGEMGLRLACKDADAIFEGSCRQEQDKIIAQSVADGGGSLLAKYNTALLSYELARKVGKIGEGKGKSPVESRSQDPDAVCTGGYLTVLACENRVNRENNAKYALSYHDVRYQQSPDYADNIKRIMAYAILLSAYDDAKGGVDIGTFVPKNQALTPAEQIEFRQAQARGEGRAVIERANARVRYESALRHWLQDNQNFVFIDGYHGLNEAGFVSSYGQMLCKKIPLGKAEQKMLATGKRYLSGPNLNRLINQEGMPLHERVYLGGGFDTFLTNPEKRGYSAFVAILASRDSAGFPQFGSVDPVASCANDAHIAARAYNIERSVLIEYIRQWFDQYEKQRTAYRFR